MGHRLNSLIRSNLSTIHITPLDSKSLVEILSCDYSNVAKFLAVGGISRNCLEFDLEGINFNVHHIVYSRLRRECTHSVTYLVS